MLYSVLKLFFCNKIIIISNTMQMISLTEFIYVHKSFQKKFSDFIIICPYTDNQVFKKIKSCHKEFIAKNNLILNFHKKIEIKILYLVLAVKKLFNLKIKQIIIGNLYSNLSKRYLEISKEVFVLDDGTNLLEKQHIKFIKKKKYSFFSCFDKKFFPKNHYKKNNFKFFKNKFIDKKKSSKDILILGRLIFGEKNPLLSDNQYYYVIEYIKDKFKNKNIYYFPHPRENAYSLEKRFQTIKFIKSEYPIEIYFLKMKKKPKTIVSFNSSAVIPLKLFDKKLNIFNIYFKIKLNKNHYWKKYLPRELSTVNYFRSKLSIKSKILELPK